MKWLLVGLLVFSVSCKKESVPTFPRPTLEPSQPQPIEDPFVSGGPLGGSTSSGDGPSNTDSVRDDGKTSMNPKLPAKDPLPRVAEVDSAGLGVIRATIAPAPGREIALTKSARGVIVALAELSKTTQPALLIEKRNGASTREILDQMEVVGDCRGKACVDGLRDQKTKTFLLANQPSQSELDAAKNGWIERLIRVAAVGEAHASIYLGRFSMSGDKTGQALLECATFTRASGKRLSLSDVIAPEQAGAKIREAQKILQEKYPTYTIDPKSFLLMGAVPKGIRLCALPPSGSNEATIIELAL